MFTIKEIREELNNYYAVNRFIRLFKFKQRYKILEMMRDRLSDSKGTYRGMAPCPDATDHYRELAERYRLQWIKCEEKLERTEKVLQEVTDKASYDI